MTVSIGELWLRGKIEHHGAEGFVQRADQKLLAAALRDLLRELERCRDGKQ